MMMPVAIALLTQATAAERAEGGLTTFSWSFMLISMAAVTLLTVWCFRRVLATKRHFDPDGTGPARPPEPADVEPGEIT